MSKTTKTTSRSYNKSIGAINVCWMIDDRHDGVQVTVHVQERGPLGPDVFGKVLGSGSGATVSEAASSATREATAALYAGE